MTEYEYDPDSEYACDMVDEDGNAVMVDNPCMCYNMRDRQAPLQSEANFEVQDVKSCVGNMAGNFPCNDMTLQSHVPLTVLNGAHGSSGDECADIWGWTSDEGKEYALICTTSGVAFVDISTPADPFYLGKLPVHNAKSSWCDVKTYADHAFIVTENGSQGLQVFNLNLLKGVEQSTTFSETAHLAYFGNAHNIAINEDTGYAYIVGSDKCFGILMYDISSPLNPTLAGCFDSDGYTHDVQCVIYNGPDNAYAGKEICFASNENTVTIVDVTDKAEPVQISRTSYQQSRYTHQGWLTEDHKYFLFNDELDEMQLNVKTTTMILNVQSLQNPVVTGKHVHGTDAIDHNLYVKGNFVYEANYRAGLRVLRIGDLEQAELTEVAYFDVYGPNDDAKFNGAWSNYPYFASGNVIISSIEGGLFTVKQGPPGPTPAPTPPPPTTSSAPNACRLLQVDGETDQYPAETDWKVKKDDNNEIVLQAELPLSSGAFSGETCLDTGDHTFTITDVYGDGMCCTYGNGFYKVTLDGTLLKEGGEYGSEEVYPFSVAGTPTSPPVANPSPTNSPVASPTTPPPVTSPTCEIPFRMGMWSDNSNTIEYGLFDDNGPVFEKTDVSPDTTYFEEACLESGKSYTVRIENPDGLCCDNGYGFAHVNVNGKVKVITKFTGVVKVIFEATLDDVSYQSSSYA